jgi:DNA-binding response OmpR family regulator
MGTNVLIVEDDSALQQMLTWELEDLGYRVTAVGSCREALDRTKTHGFDLVLLDYCLPDGNGVELLRTLRRRAPTMPVVMNSGQTGPETRNRALEHGAAFILVQTDIGCAAAPGV